MRNSYKRKTQIYRPKHRWEHKYKMDHKEAGYVSVDSIHIAQDKA
jgi:hypothetical protein